MAHGLGKLIKRLREQSEEKWTLARLGEALGVGKSYLSKVENEEIEKLTDKFLFAILDLLSPKTAHHTGMTIRACLHALGCEPNRVEVTKLGSEVVAINCYGPPPLIPDWNGLPELPEVLATTRGGWFHRLNASSEIAKITSPVISYVTSEPFANQMVKHAEASRAASLTSSPSSGFP